MKSPNSTCLRAWLTVPSASLDLEPATHSSSPSRRASSSIELSDPAPQAHGTCGREGEPFERLPSCHELPAGCGDLQEKEIFTVT